MEEISASITLQLIKFYLTTKMTFDDYISYQFAVVVRGFCVCFPGTRCPCVS